MLRVLTILFCVALSLAATCVLLASAAPAVQQLPASDQTSLSTAEHGLSPAERRGKAVYLRGSSDLGKEITAMVGDLEVPASTLTCGGCHGPHGEGKTEGGVTAGDLTWSNLVKTYGHTHPSGRKHGPFNESLFARALVQGVDPAGNELAVAMPRFRMSAEDVADLIAYLKRIGTDRDPGLSETTIKVGTILPQQGGLAEIGAAMKDVLAAYFENVNEKGGIYNRKIELQAVETGADATATAANARKLVEKDRVFAIVSGLSAGADKEISALVQQEDIPYLGPLTLLPQTGALNNRNVFYLLPGAGEQARALINFASDRPELKQSRLAIVHSENEIAQVAATAIEDQASKVGWSPLTTKAYAPENFDAAKMAQTLKAEGAQAVFFFGAGDEEAAFIKAAAAADWTPDVFLLGSFAGRSLLETVPLSFKDHVFLSFPTVPSDLTRAGMSELHDLQVRYKFPPRHTASQLMAFAAARILTEALQRAGRDLSREKLITALEGLYEFETDVTPKITFGPNRRVGAKGAYVVAIDPAKKEFVAASGWVKNN